MTLPQLSPVVVVGNPLTHHNNTAPAAVAGSMAQQNVSKKKSDSVTISREAMAKAAQAGAKSGNDKEAQTKEAAKETKAS